ncbi:LysR family transcriptional regulator [Amycolatopsis sp. NPDC051903]|uniref:LysR family transcriptional regulator n=1 Tax=Amycolatopsis sp. NPDC051903 TaxID=3363936 RepID=UPI00378C9EFB
MGEGVPYAQAGSQTKSFSGAACAYGVTQPALSNGVARLEAERGCARRSTRRGRRGA